MTIKGTTARTKSSIEKHLKATVNMHVASIMGLRKCEKIPKTDAGFRRPFKKLFSISEKMKVTLNFETYK